MGNVFLRVSRYFTLSVGGGAGSCTLDLAWPRENNSHMADEISDRPGTLEAANGRRNIVGGLGMSHRDFYLEGFFNRISVVVNVILHFFPCFG